MRNQATRTTEGRHPSGPGAAGPSGFTMIELLVVIGIMSLMVVLAVSLMGGFVGTAKEKATQATVRKIDAALQERADALDRLFEGQQANYFQTELVALKQSQGLDDATARILLKKTKFREGFPQSFAEANFAAKKQVFPTTSTPNDPTECAEVLYWVLTESSIVGLQSVEPGRFSSSEVMDTDGDGFMELVDAWERPLRFYRWPTRLIRPQSPGSTDFRTDPIRRQLAGILWAGLPPVSGATDPLRSDPDDPLGRFSKRLFQPGGDPVTFENNFHTPDTYHAFLVVSGGVDNNLGLFEPQDVQNLGHLAQPTDVLPAGGPEVSDATNAGLFDNITNRNAGR